MNIVVERICFIAILPSKVKNAMLNLYEEKSVLKISNVSKMPVARIKKTIARANAVQIEGDSLK